MPGGAEINLRGRPAAGDVGRVLILNTLAPVFLLIAIGVVLQSSQFVSPGFLREANRVTYWLGLPALLFSQLAGSFHTAGAAQTMLLAMLVATLVVMAVGFGVARALRLPGPGIGTFVQGAFRGNLAFVGLPIVYAMPDVELPGGVSLRAAAIVVVAPMMVFYNTGGIVVLLLSRHKLGWRMLVPFVKQLVSSPPLVATIAGIGFALMGWKLPQVVDKTFTSLGEMALPLGLLGVGGSLVTVKLGAAWRAPLSAALVKTLVSPALGWAIARAWGLQGIEVKTLMIFMATPTAVVSYTVAVELQGDEGLAAGTIVLSTLLSLVSLIVIVGLF